MRPVAGAFSVRDDKLLAAAHESAHRTLADHLNAHWSAAWIWPNGARWAGSCRYSGVDATLTPLVAAAGAVGEALLHGFQNTADMIQFVGAEDAAAMGDVDLESALLFGRHALGGERRAAWLADAGRLYNDTRVGQWDRSSRPAPSEWTAMVGDTATRRDRKMSGATQYRNDADCFSKINAFFQEKLSPEDISTAEDLLDALVAELTGDQTGPSLASDAVLRQRFLRRFPNSNRLTKRYG